MGKCTEHGQVDTGVNLHGAMDFVNLAKFHSKLALSFHPKLFSHPAVTEREVHPFLMQISIHISHIVTWSYRTQPLVNGLALAIYVYMGQTGV